MKTHLAILALFLSVALACSSVSDLSRLLTPTYAWVTPTPSVTVENADASSTPPDITPPSHTPSRPLDPTCVPPSPPPAMEEIPFDGYPQAILEFVNAGGTPAELEAALGSLGIANAPNSVAAGDLTGDGYDDLAVSLLDPDAQTVQPPGVLLLYVCQGGEYVLSHLEPSQEFFRAPAILRLQDINADGRTELIYSSSTCGAHTCFESAQILGWNGETFEHLLEGSTEDLPSPNIQITDYDLDGIYALEVLARGYGSVGAGPQRGITQIWEFDPGSGRWLPGEQRTGPSDFRIHLVHDADDAMRRGEYQVAILLYEQVINDPNLKYWMDEDAERLNLGAYARFKIVVAYALQGNTDQAQDFLDAISQLYPAGAPQRDYVEMAQVFLDAFLADGQEASCSAAHEYAAAHADTVLVPLGSQTYGYANPDYEPQDVCP